MFFPYVALWFLPGWAAILDFQNLSRRLSRVSNLGFLYLWLGPVYCCQFFSCVQRYTQFSQSVQARNPVLNTTYHKKLNIQLFVPTVTDVWTTPLYSACVPLVGRISMQCFCANAVGITETSAPESQINSCVNSLLPDWTAVPVSVINFFAAENEFIFAHDCSQPPWSLKTAKDEGLEQDVAVWPFCQQRWERSSNGQSFRKCSADWQWKHPWLFLVFPLLGFGGKFLCPTNPTVRFVSSPFLDFHRFLWIGRLLPLLWLSFSTIFRPLPCRFEIVYFEVTFGGAVL